MTTFICFKEDENRQKTEMKSFFILCCFLDAVKWIMKYEKNNKSKRWKWNKNEERGSKKRTQKNHKNKLRVRSFDDENEVGKGCWKSFHLMTRKQQKQKMKFFHREIWKNSHHLSSSWYALEQPPKWVLIEIIKHKFMLWCLCIFIYEKCAVCSENIFMCIAKTYQNFENPYVLVIVSQLLH